MCLWNHKIIECFGLEGTL